MKLIDLFENVSPRKINVQWAVGSNADKASRGTVKDMQDPYYSVVWLPIKAVMEKTLSWQSLDVNEPTGGKNAIGRRVDSAKEYWRTGGFMDPSLLSLDSSSNNVIAFSDGRHRMIAAHQLGEVWAPAIVPKKHVTHLQKIMNVKKTIPTMLESILNENHKVILKTWHKPSEGKVIEVKGGEHWEEVDDHPSKFGLPPTHEIDHFNVIANMVDDGWVRASYEIPFSRNKIMFAEGINLRDLRQVVRYYIKRYPEIEKVILNTRDYDSPQLEGNQIDQFIRTGRIQRDRVGVELTENFEDSIYGAWYDINTNKLYDLGPEGGAGYPPHLWWLINNLEVMGETKKSLQDSFDAQTDDIEDYMFLVARKYGMVRIAFPDSTAQHNEYTINGGSVAVKKYLKRYQRTIAQSIKNQEIDVIFIDLGIEGNGYDYMFEFDQGPISLRKFNQFIMS